MASHRGRRGRPRRSHPPRLGADNCRPDALAVLWSAATFPATDDQRHAWSAAQIAATVDEVERFRFLEGEARSIVRAAVAYPLSFPEVSAVLLGTKTAAQAESNFGEIPGARLSTASLRRVLALQDELDLGDRRSLRSLAKRVLGRF